MGKYWSTLSIELHDLHPRKATILLNGQPVPGLRAPGAAVDTLALALTVAAPATGVAVLTLTAAQTAALGGDRAYTYEVELQDSTGAIATPVEGTVWVDADRG